MPAPAQNIWSVREPIDGESNSRYYYRASPLIGLPDRLSLEFSAEDEPASAFTPALEASRLSSNDTPRIFPRIATPLTHLGGLVAKHSNPIF